MSRDEFRDAARAAIVSQAPSLAVGIVEQLIESPAAQRWFDSIARRRPHGIVAFVRRLRGKERGLTDEQRKELDRLVSKTLEKYR